MKRAKLDKRETGVRKALFAALLCKYVDESHLDSVEWISELCPQGFDVDEEEYDVDVQVFHAPSTAVRKRKPNALRWMVDKGADVSLIERDVMNKPDMKRVYVQGLFKKALVDGLFDSLLSSSVSEFSAFLTRGVYDPQILGRVAEFL